MVGETSADMCFWLGRSHQCICHFHWRKRRRACSSFFPRRWLAWSSEFLEWVLNDLGVHTSRTVAAHHPTDLTCEFRSLLPSTTGRGQGVMLPSCAGRVPCFRHWNPGNLCRAARDSVPTLCWVLIHGYQLWNIRPVAFKCDTISGGCGMIFCNSNLSPHLSPYCSFLNRYWPRFDSSGAQIFLPPKCRCSWAFCELSNFPCTEVASDLTNPGAWRLLVLDLRPATEFEAGGGRCSGGSEEALFMVCWFVGL